MVNKKILTALAFIFLISLATAEVSHEADQIFFTDNDNLQQKFDNGDFGKWDDGAAAGDIYYDDGNVGIGTDSPDAPLHVTGNMKVVDHYFDANDDHWLRIRDADGGTYKDLAVGDFHTAGSITLGGVSRSTWPATGITTCSTCDSRFVNAAGDTMSGSLGVSGYVGAGTTSPTKPLDVRGQIMAYYDTDNWVVLYPGGDTTALIWDSDVGTSGRFDFGTWNQYTGGDYTVRMAIEDEGNVGIGTTNPSTKLHVNGGMRATSVAATGVDSISVGLTLSDEGDYKRLQSWGGEILTINPEGNGVIIGATEWATTPINLEVRGHTRIYNGNFWVYREEGRAIESSGADIGVWSWGNSYDFYAAGPGTNYGSSSSIRWKENIQPIDNPLEKVTNLRGVYFDWDEEHGGQHDMGMIAEEVGIYVPEIVQYEEDGYYASGMDYSKLTPLLVEAIKEQQSQIEELKNIICEENPQRKECN